MMKKFRCMPIAIGIPMVCILFLLYWILLMIYIKQDNLHSLTILYVSLCVIIAGLTLPNAVRRIEIHKDKVVCKGLFPSQTYEIEYEKCNIGMDYSWRSGGKIWWIYICYGPPPRFKSVNSPNRMNAEKFKPGFIKMHYNDKVYDALLEVLPKQQRSALISAKKWADKAKNK